MSVSSWLIRLTAAFAVFALLVIPTAVAAQEPAEAAAEEEPAPIWTDQADLGFLLTKGNSENVNLSVDNVLQGNWDKSTFNLRVGAYRQESNDITRFAVGTGQNDFVADEFKERSLDAFRLYLFSDYKRTISDRFFWQVGANWDKDDDAGIESRFVGYAGVGNVWVDSDRSSFSTSYALSYTSRTDEIEDPDNDGQFIGGRLAWNFMQKVLDSSEITNDMTFFMNFDQMKDNRFINTTALTTSMSSKLSIRLSAEFRYSNLPSLEEIDLYDGDPSAAGSSLIGTVNARKEKLDSIFRATIVVNF